MDDLPADPRTAGTVMVGMSGGVDSAVAALLLLRAGFVVHGLHMTNWDEQDAYCTAAADYQDARRVCEILGIPLHRADFAEAYRERVFGHFLREYAAGRTPNPDVLCNREIKFGVCLDHLLRLGGSWIATGHYAGVKHLHTGAQLRKAADQSKDQSYFLHAVTRAALGRTLFPLGNLQKSEVRRLAHEAGLPVHDKPDSTGICFIGERPFREFLGRYLRPEPGSILTPEGRRLGEHRGLPFYTLGQRGGLGIGGRSGAAAAPWFVAAKDPDRNALIVVQSPDHPLLLCDRFEAAQLNWLAEPAGSGWFDCAVKTRYRQRDLPCRVRRLDEARVEVALAQPARAVTPGQYAVFYSGDVCLGGGVIETTRPRREALEDCGFTYNRAFTAEGS
ncbi:MAG: tRNA 2-thiouridine(34) synthase MnmA [Gammaproteobacteria bacterium]|nr:tRNA 2-thiouridine(34) synthase MnmA [Gammaproteobacteria bacterium]